MATDEERAMAEYEAALNDDDDDEDEAEFNPDFDEVSDDDDEDEEDDDGEEDEEEDYAVLRGSLHLNDEGRVVFSGTWSMKKELDAEQDEEDHSKKDEDANSPAKDGGENQGHRHHKKKKKTKFKLKSKQIFVKPAATSGDNDAKGPLFDLSNPTLTKKGLKEIPMKRSMLFDGFFFAALTDEQKAHQHHGRKIKERDVEVIFFSILPSDEEGGDEGGAAKEEAASHRRYGVSGRGCNEYGKFELHGTYTVPLTGPASEDNSLICDKKYASSRDEAGPRRRSSQRRGRDESYDLDENEDEHDDILSDAGDGGGVDELIALNEEAGMSVEELRKRYYGDGCGADDSERHEGRTGEVSNGKDQGSDTKPPAAKKLKRSTGGEEESDDDEYGF